MIFDRLFETRDSHPRDPALSDWLGLGGMSATGMPVTAETALQEAAVMSCVRVLSEDIAKLPLIVYQKKGDIRRRATEHPLYELLHLAPNANQTSMEWREACQAQLLLRGNTVNRIKSTGGRGVSELEPLHPDRVEILKGNTGRRVYRYTPDSGPQQIILPSEVLHVPGLSLDGGISGLNPIRYHRETIGLGLGMKEFGAKLFKNGVNSNLAVIHPGSLKGDQLKEYRESIEKVMTGRNNWHRPLVFEGGAKVEKLSMTAEDSQFLDSRKYNRSEIAGIFRVPLYKIAGDAEKAKGWSTLEQQATDYVVDSLMPWMVRWEQAMTRQLLTAESRRDGYYIQFELKGLLRGDTKTRAEYYKMRFALGSLSPDDIRRLEEEDPIGTDAAKAYYIMTNMTTLDRVATGEGSNGTGTQNI